MLRSRFASATVALVALLCLAAPAQGDGLPRGHDISDRRSFRAATRAPGINACPPGRFGGRRTVGEHAFKPFERQLGEQSFREPGRGWSIEGAERPFRESAPTAEELRAAELQRTRFATGEDLTPRGGGVRHVASIADTPAQEPAREAAKPAAIKTLVLLPRDERSFERMFGASPTAAQHVEVNKISELFQKQGAALVSREPESGTKAAVLHALSEAAKMSAVVTLIAHASRGPTGLDLVMPSGDRLAMTEAASTVAQTGAELVVISCYSSDVNPDSAITLREAYHVWSSATAGLEEAYVSALEQRSFDQTDQALTSYSTQLAEARLTRDLVVNADKARGSYPGIDLHWTQRDSSDYQSLFTSARVLSLPGGWLNWFPLPVGLVALAFLLSSPQQRTAEEGFSAESLRKRARDAYRRRRQNTTLLGGVVLVQASVVGTLGFRTFTTRSSETKLNWEADSCALACGLAVTLLAAAIAKRGAYESELASLMHGLAGAIVGLLSVPLVLVGICFWSFSEGQQGVQALLVLVFLPVQIFAWIGLPAWIPPAALGGALVGYVTVLASRRAAAGRNVFEGYLYWSS